MKRWARGDAPWAVHAFRRSLLVTLAATALPSAALVLAGRPLISFWVGRAVEPEPWLLTGLGLWTVLGGLGSALSMLLNAAGVVKFQVATAVVTAICAVTGKIMLGREVGLPGIIWGTIVAYVLFSLAPTTWYVRRFISRLQQSADPLHRMTLLVNPPGAVPVTRDGC